MTKWKSLFMSKSILGRTTDLRKPDAVIMRCVGLAYKDMLDGGRFYLYKRSPSKEEKEAQDNQKDTLCRSIVDLLEVHEYAFSRALISEAAEFFGDRERIGSGKRYVTRYGLAQKFVNMTFKYLYIFSDYTGKDIDFSKCDCPLDSIILGQLPPISHSWSKITPEEYAVCQNNVKKELEDNSLDDELKMLGNLAFDFLGW